MGLLDMLIPGVGSNPFYQAFDQNRGKITGAFGGMVGAGNDPRQALVGFRDGLQHGVGVDQENAIIRQKQAEDAAKIKQQQEQQNATVQWLQQKATTDPRYAELVQGLNAGALTPSDAWQKGLEYSQPAKKQYQEVGGKLYDMSGDTPTLAVDPYAESGGVNPKDAFGNEKDLFAQYSNSDTVKLYENVKSGYERVRASATDQTGAGDLSLIYGFMKMVDPGAVVRESDFALAAQAGDFGEQIQGLVSRIVSGQRLPPEQRAEFLKMAEKLYLESAQNLSGINEQFAGRADAWGVNPGNFIRAPEMYPTIQPAVPPPAAFGTGGGNPYGPSTGNTITLGNGMTLEVY